MSKIYRRPMFRGGGKVSSYGNGITAPLVPGYQGGGQIGGGQIYGTPMSDGRYGFAQPLSLSEKLKADGLTNGVGMSGENLILGSDLYNPNKFINNIAPRKVNIEEEVSTSTDDNASSKNIETVDTNVIDDTVLNSDFDQTEERTIIDADGNKKIVQANVPAEEVEPNLDVLKNLPLWAGGITKEEYNIRKNKQEVKKIQKRVNDDQSNIARAGGADAAQDDFDPGFASKEIGEGVGDKSLVVNQPEETQISAKDAIRENQALFKELLGGKAARGQDISDMLLRFSGSEGNTLGEKFKSYTKAESAAGPGRGEKINQTAAALAINDYVAGKRSKEQSEYLTKKIDYEYKKKGELSTLNLDDDVGTALAKSSKLTGASFKSLKNIKNLINKKTDRDDIFEGNIKMKDLNPETFKQKKVNKLKPGYNIVEDEGVKRIVLIGNDGTNNTVISIQTITELWSGK